MQLVPQAVRPRVAGDDEALGGQSAARLLITASTPRAVETIARRVHMGGRRATLPFVQACAGEFPCDLPALRTSCLALCEAAAGGSLLIHDIEEMPQNVQDDVIGLLAEIECSRAPFEAVRVVSGTTVPLLDRVAAGTFSKDLFYQLNIIHLLATDDMPPVQGA